MTVVPGVTDTGNHTDEGVTFINLPFAFTLYDRTFNTANVSANGNIQFNSTLTDPHIPPDSCIPAPVSFSYTIFPYWGDLTTEGTWGGIPLGIRTSISGSAPDRIFNIEWRACQYAYINRTRVVPCDVYVNFEVRLFENTSQFDVVYGTVQNGYNVGIGVQKDSMTYYTQYKCDTSNALTNNSFITFTQPPCKLANCPIAFQDVPSQNTFQTSVACLACRGVMQGYPCGGPGEPCVCPTSNPYFRYGFSATRGAIAKMVANAAGFAETLTGAQTFQDVPLGSTFHEFIERLARRGYIGGYACGGPGEPCVPPDNRPYFRPIIGVTRGQLTKIVAGAAGFNEPVPANRQSFEDVLYGSAFWEYVERLYARNVINGYPCGGQGEPCVPPNNRPYFRPGNPVTRGQTAKIIANSFYSDCGPAVEVPQPVPTVPGDLPLPIPTVEPPPP
jgi:hypothetical protein